MSIAKKEIRHELWRRGELSWIMHSVQKEMYEVYKNAENNSILVWLLARQSGKSFNLALIGVMEAIRHPNSIIKLLTDTKLHVKTIFEPLFREIFDNNDCPKDVRPTYNPSLFLYSFPNGSQIQLAGSDGNSAERLRGQKSTLVLVDEAAFCNNLSYNVMSILLPTTTHTGGKIILATTPPEDSDHDFMKFLEKAEVERTLTKKTVYDNPLLTPDQIKKIAAQFVGGVNDPQFRREYLCEIIKNESKSVFPEANEDLIKEIVREHPRPPYFDAYVSMDIGFKDLTVVLFGYYDFRADKVVIESEIVKHGKELRLKEFSDEILKVEEELWLNVLTNEVKKPAMRVSDIDHIVTNEIYNHSSGKLYFTNVTKERGFKLPIINNIRMLLKSGKIVIHPRCKTLIRHLMNSKWKDSVSKDDFARSPDEGHYDAADALIYMVKTINFSKNPYPAGYSLSGNTQDWFIKDRSRFYNQSGDAASIIRSIYGPPKKR